LAQAGSSDPERASDSSPDATAQLDSSPSDPQVSPQAQQPVTMVDHNQERYWLAGQINVIGQAYGSFPALYSGPNSLRSTAQAAVSNVLTLYTGLMVNQHTEIELHIESAGGHGVSEALGLAGFTNLDVVRNPDLGQTPYVARFMIREIIPLSSETIEADRGPLAIASRLPAKRIELRVGKFSAVDFFDVNAVGSDSHLQFMNWTIDNNGAYDYAANTRGYTWGLIAEYDDRKWALRFGLAMMPKVANGPHLDADLFRARGDNIELEIHRGLIPHRDGTIRVLSYVNHADMGSYREAIQEYRAGQTSTPDIITTRSQGRIKYGFGINLEQPITSRLRSFARLGWNDGKNESFAYTECDRTSSFGADLKGDFWRRPLDKVGAALVVNGITGDHREYLRLGGVGFILGDGNLNYGTEQIFESYYTAHLWRGLFVSADGQHVSNPGYNRDRGPVWVGSLRVHIDF
jgi:hypothetical protein